MPEILIIEDQKRLQSSLRRGLEDEGYEVLSALSGEEGFYLAATTPCDAVILDLMLPKRDGLSVLKDLRAHHFNRPVLILTARDSVEDRVAGLDAGADDYLIKPFAFAELVARLRVMLRRNISEREVLLQADNLELDLVTRRVVRGGRVVELSQREFELLEYLLRFRNMNVTRDMIGRDVWKSPDGVWTNVIDVCINSLRKKVEESGQRKLIHTVRGVGYSLRDT
jgi:two-component system copper resistance phosphate regulon response regulator CusR